ncbi:MAG: hypothetical protein O2816_09885, partial [Planctomycetota bacterium]|nr:hypothetical protein [Planctomycetota bacterium]
GTVLWERDLPGLSRTGFPFDGGYLAADRGGLWCGAGPRAVHLDARTGATRAEVSAPNGAWHWLAQDDDVLFGSCGAAGAPRRDQSRAEVVDQYRDRRPLVVSQTVFRAGGWQHRGGAIPTSTLAVAGGRLHFLESALAGDPGRARLGDLLSAGADLVALDVTSGEVLWRRPFEVREEVHVLYTIAAAGRLVSVGSYDHEDRIWYRVRVHDAATGEELWSATHANNRSGTGGDHGEQVHHPLLRGRTLIVEPLAYDLDTGHVVDPTGGQGWSIPARGGCGTISASSNALFFRDGHPTILDLVPGGGRRKLTEVTRPGCWINVLPAAGLVLVPEASSGCVCAYPVQTSMAFLPVAD